ncbi:MAG: hypothetical protein J0H07_09410 [Sphingobacteriales bacterium]|nr:hypothetical protein [Sphingobacteriales bacterium]
MTSLNEKSEACHMSLPLPRKDKAAEKQFADMEPMGRFAASFVTGQALAVDGGWIAT